MAIEKMEMVSVTGEYAMLDRIIEAYLDSGCFQPEAASQIVNNLKGFTHINDENPYAARFAKIAEIFSSCDVPLDNAASSETRLSDGQINEKLDIFERRIGALQNRRKDLTLEISNIETSISRLEHFVNFDFKLHEIFKSEFIKIRIGRLPAESFEKLQFYNSNPYVLFFPCSNEGDYLWGIYVSPADSGDEVGNIFASLFFERLDIPDAVGTPRQAVDGLAAELAEKRSELAALEKSVNEFKANEMNEYVALYAQLKRSRDAFEIRRYGTRYGDTFMLIGWIPAKDKKIFIRYMDNFDAVEYKFENPENAGSLKPPVKLKNLKIFKPFEYYVEMFGVPGYSEIDPTPFVALTYTLLYGIMFADVGQGLVLSLAGYLMYKIKGMALGKILVPCGISGSFFGLVFGSVFGYEHVLDGFYKALGFSEKPIHVMGAIMPILFTGIGIGVALMFIAIIISIYSNFKRGHPGEAVFGENGICGLIIYASVITLLLSVFVPMFAPGFAPVFTPVIKPVMPYVASSIAISLCILLFKEPLSHIIEKKPLKMSGMGQYLTQSFFEVFESFLSYITNTVSFLRVGAFVFVHAGMMMVFSTLSEMFGGGIAGAVIMIFGNMLVLALEGLLVGVQSLRLEFYEMFSRFFKGDGKPYRPITLNLHNQNIN